MDVLENASDLSYSVIKFTKDEIEIVTAALFVAASAVTGFRVPPEVDETNRSSVRIKRTSDDWHEIVLGSRVRQLRANRKGGEE